MSSVCRSGARCNTEQYDEQSVDSTVFIPLEGLVSFLLAAMIIDVVSEGPTRLTEQPNDLAYEPHIDT